MPFHIVFHGAKPLCLAWQNYTTDIADLRVQLFDFLFWAPFNLMHCQTDFIVQILFSSISLFVMLCVHLGHRVTSFLLLLVTRNKISALKSIALIPSSCYGTGEAVGNQSQEMSFHGAFCSPRLESQRTRERTE